MPRVLVSVLSSCGDRWWENAEWNSAWSTRRPLQYMQTRVSPRTCAWSGFNNSSTRSSKATQSSAKCLMASFGTPANARTRPTEWSRYYHILEFLSMEILHAHFIDHCCARHAH